MIKGTAKLEFGTGDIGILSRCEPEKGLLYFKNQEAREIGVHGESTHDYDYDSADVIMEFTKVESIDTVIEQLLNAKRMIGRTKTQ